MNWKSQQEKKLLAVVREIDRLKDRISNPKLVRLERPIRRGWVRSYVLSESARSREDVETIAAILKEIGTVQYHWRRNFRRGRRFARKAIEIEQKLKSIPAWKWRERKLPEAWLPFFYIEQRWWWGRWINHFVFSDPSLFELRVQPRLIWTIKVLDSEAMKRLAELENWMESNCGWPRYHRLRGCGNWWRRHQRQLWNAVQDRVIRKEVQEALIEHEMSDEKELVFELFLIWHFDGRPPRFNFAPMWPN